MKTLVDSVTVGPAGKRDVALKRIDALLDEVPKGKTAVVVVYVWDFNEKEERAAA